MFRNTAIALFVAMSMAALAQADWVISDSTTSVLDFESDFAGVYSHQGASATVQGSVAEPGSYHRGTSNYAGAVMCSEGVAVSATANDPSGRGSGLPTYFGADYNKNAVTTDSTAMVHGSYVDINPGAPVTGNAFCLANAAWESTAVYFRILNNTGATVTDWNFQMDLYADETGSWATAGSIISFSYAVDGGDDPAAMSFTDLGLPMNITQTDDLVLFSQPDLTASTSVADGEYIVFQINQNDQGGNGSVVLLDNIAVTAAAVPEPATMSLLVLGGGYAMLKRRRR